MTKMVQILMITLFILLLISATINVLQYNNSKNPTVKTVTVRDTISRTDTIIRLITSRVVVEKPVPVSFDTLSNMRIYRDTIFHPYGTIRREETVLGQMVKKDIDLDFKIPEITRTITVNQVTTHTVRNRLLYVTVGLVSGLDGRSNPSVGAAYILKDHKIFLGVDYGMDKSINARIGFNILK